MNLNKVLTALVVAASAYSIPLHSQDLFRLNFHATCRTLKDNGRLGSVKINEDDLIARCVGTNSASTNREYELVYNETSNSVQVVRASTGAFVCDVFQFEGGVTNSDGRKQERLTFVFSPDQPEAVGTAVINEKPRHKANRASIQGKVQFTLLSGQSTGQTSDTNAPSGTNDLGGPVTPTNTFGGINPPGLTNNSPGPIEPGSNAATNTVTGTNTQGPVLGGSGLSSGSSEPGTGTAINLTPPTPPGTGGTGPAGMNTLGARTLAITPPSSGTNNLGFSDLNVAGNTNGPSGVDLTAGGTALLAGDNFTNIWICSGNFSGGRRVFVVEGAP